MPYHIIFRRAANAATGEGTLSNLIISAEPLVATSAQRFAAYSAAAGEGILSNLIISAAPLVAASAQRFTAYSPMVIATLAPSPAFPKHHHPPNTPSVPPEKGANSFPVPFQSLFNNLSPAAREAFQPSPHDHT